MTSCYGYEWIMCLIYDLLNGTGTVVFNKTGYSENCMSSDRVVQNPTNSLECRHL